MGGRQALSCDEDLIEAARAAMAHAHAPYSGFPVGAAVRLNDGTIITGANMENASFGLSLCAEAVAIASASSAGRLRDIVALAIAAAAIETGESGSAVGLTPCGRCRQILAEAASLAARDIPVYCANALGDSRAVYRISELLPHAFSAAAFSGGPRDE
ncbi:MAG: cytidine deaminase [Sphingobium sp.]